MKTAMLTSSPSSRVSLAWISRILPEIRGQSCLSAGFSEPPRGAPCWDDFSARDSENCLLSLAF